MCVRVCVSLSGARVWYERARTQRRKKGGTTTREGPRKQDDHRDARVREKRALGEDQAGGPESYTTGLALAVSARQRKEESGSQGKGRTQASSRGTNSERPGNLNSETDTPRTHESPISDSDAGGRPRIYPPFTHSKEETTHHDQAGGLVRVLTPAQPPNHGFVGGYGKRETPCASHSRNQGILRGTTGLAPVDIPGTFLVVSNRQRRRRADPTRAPQTKEGRDSIGSRRKGGRSRRLLHRRKGGTIPAPLEGGSADTKESPERRQEAGSAAGLRQSVCARRHPLHPLLRGARTSRTLGDWQVVH